MDKISGMVERGRNITNETVIPDYVKYLKKTTDEQRKSREEEYFSTFQTVLMKPEITIGFLKVAIAAKGVIIKQIKAESKPSMKDFCVSRVLHYYETYREFKCFVTLHDLSRHNQVALLKLVEDEIKNPHIITDNDADN